MTFNRRQALKTFGITAGAALLKLPATAAVNTPKASPAFKYSLNMSTIRGQKLGFIKELETASKAGFRHVEIWIDTFQTYLQQGGSVTEARKIIEGLGLQIENAIGFARWIVDDEATRKAGLAQLQQEMEQLAKIGCKRIAAPPMGANNAHTPVIDLNVVTERYLAILEMGEKTGVLPILEMWGGSPNLKKISQVLYVVTESGHKNARVLLDSFHIFKGGSSFDSTAFVGKPAIDIFHVNDYPAGISPEKISEPDRIYPGDGIAPLRQLMQCIRNPEKPVIISLEVFNNSYYQQDALLVAKTGLAKMKAITAGL
ncbi:sugar phosphate isomerase/epimerase family protein [Chitinophaga arvensicola]|uniref:Sugar phosphate isomerase/epimerase n=1 Tax=Chitinophaga arvensicola TaxID=29529 RepID=A0A1I0S808_9BACT|nr:sugar phosphate isomerase/epimerase family protein [Chitinophaga arvensicola]SEW51810.1 Sugar phosphate isomerase/epimerase [Chitinophaga arvensicola]